MSLKSSHVNNRKVMRKPYQMSVSDQAPEASALYQPLRFWNIIPSVSWGCKILDGALSVNLNVILQQFVVTSTHLHLQYICLCNKKFCTYQIQTHMSIAKYLPWNPMSHHFSYAALTLCLRFPSFGLREGNCQKTLTRSLRRSHWIIFDSRSTTRAYAKSLQSQRRKKMTKNETDWAHEASSRENSGRNSRRWLKPRRPDH